MASVNGEEGMVREARSRRVARHSDTELALRAISIRRSVVELAHRYPDVPFHLGGSLSCAEIMAVLLGDVMRTGADGTPWEVRDRLVLSKGHASLALWPALVQCGLLSEEDYGRGLFGDDAVIGKQPKRDVSRGIELSGGSLGMGLGYASGLALAARRRGLPSRVYCVMGDGECDEGSVWEAASFAGHNRLGSLTVIVDANGLQLDGPTAQVLDSGPLTSKFAAFGFDVQVVDGHSVRELRDALLMRAERPMAVVARTVKGKGISFAEGNVTWHDHCLDEDGYSRAMTEFAAAEREVLRDAE
ncbi:MAG: transketolase [Acidobacteriota bacterium]|nr:transketolase [Acidobacteriota bacterium]